MDNDGNTNADGLPQHQHAARRNTQPTMNRNEQPPQPPSSNSNAPVAETVRSLIDGDILRVDVGSGAHRLLPFEFVLRHPTTGAVPDGIRVQQREGLWMGVEGLRFSRVAVDDQQIAVPTPQTKSRAEDHQSEQQRQGNADTNLSPIGAADYGNTDVTDLPTTELIEEMKQRIMHEDFTETGVIDKFLEMLRVVPVDTLVDVLVDLGRCPLLYDQVPVKKATIDQLSMESILDHVSHRIKRIGMRGEKLVGGHFQGLLAMVKSDYMIRVLRKRGCLPSENVQRKLRDEVEKFKRKWKKCEESRKEVKKKKEGAVDGDGDDEKDLVDPGDQAHGLSSHNRAPSGDESEVQDFEGFADEQLPDGPLDTPPNHRHRSAASQQHTENAAPEHDRRNRFDRISNVDQEDNTPASTGRTALNPHDAKDAETEDTNADTSTETRRTQNDLPEELRDHLSGSARKYSANDRIRWPGVEVITSGPGYCTVAGVPEKRVNEISPEHFEKRRKNLRKRRFEMSEQAFVTEMKEIKDDADDYMESVKKRPGRAGRPSLARALSLPGVQQTPTPRGRDHLATQTGGRCVERHEHVAGARIDETQSIADRNRMPPPALPPTPHGRDRGTPARATASGRSEADAEAEQADMTRLGRAGRKVADAMTRRTNMPSENSVEERPTAQTPELTANTARRPDIADSVAENVADEGKPDASIDGEPPKKKAKRNASTSDKPSGSSRRESLPASASHTGGRVGRGSLAPAGRRESTINRLVSASTQAAAADRAESQSNTPDRPSRAERASTSKTAGAKRNAAKMDSGDDDNDLGDRDDRPPQRARKTAIPTHVLAEDARRRASSASAASSPARGDRGSVDQPRRMTVASNQPMFNERSSMAAPSERPTQLGTDTCQYPSSIQGDEHPGKRSKKRKAKEDAEETLDTRPHKKRQTSIKARQEEEKKKREKEREEEEREMQEEETEEAEIEAEVEAEEEAGEEEDGEED